MLIRNETHFNCFLPWRKSSSGLVIIIQIWPIFGRQRADRPTSCAPLQNLFSFVTYCCCCDLGGPAGWWIACRAVYVQYLITVIAIMYVYKEEAAAVQVLSRHAPTSATVSFMRALSAAAASSLRCECAKSSISQNALFNCKKRALYCPNERSPHGRSVRTCMHARDHAVLNHGGFLYTNALYFQACAF